MNLNKIERSLEQNRNTYKLKLQQAESELKTLQSIEKKQKIKVNELNNVLNQFNITAPADGMVIYKKEQDGSKRKIGSTINSFDLVIATLPDMSSMLSKTYVNEIDVTKVKIGQKVRITIDAFTDKQYTGKVISISNVGEQLSNTNAKVFEVNVLLDKSDEYLRPSMTSGNAIIVNTIKNVIYISLVAVKKKAIKHTFIPKIKRN